MPLDNTTTVIVEVFKMAERLDGCRGETRKKRLQRKMNKDYLWGDFLTSGIRVSATDQHRVFTFKSPKQAHAGKIPSGLFGGKLQDSLNSQNYGDFW